MNNVEKLEDTKVVIRGRKWKVRQHNGQQIEDKRIWKTKAVSPVGHFFKTSMNLTHVFCFIAPSLFSNVYFLMLSVNVSGKYGIC
jgi:hypothetical protein